jgi:hypothetical protein
MEKEVMEKDMIYDHFVNEENMDTHDMNPSSPLDNLELVPFYLNCYSIINSPISTKIDQACFLIVVGLFSETSCSKNHFYLLLSSNHEHVLKDISDSRIMQDKDNNDDIFTQGEINTQDITLL